MVKEEVKWLNGRWREGERERGRGETGTADRKEKEEL